MADFENSNLMTFVINEIYDSVLALAHPIAISVSSKLLGAFRAGIGAQCLVGGCSSRDNGALVYRVLSNEMK